MSAASLPGGPGTELPDPYVTRLCRCEDGSPQQVRFGRRRQSARSGRLRIPRGSPDKVPIDRLGRASRHLRKELLDRRLRRTASDGAGKGTLAFASESRIDSGFRSIRSLAIPPELPRRFESTSALISMRLRLAAFPMSSRIVHAVWKTSASLGFTQRDCRALMNSDPHQNATVLVVCELVAERQLERPRQVRRRVKIAQMYQAGTLKIWRSLED